MYSCMALWGAVNGLVSLGAGTSLQSIHLFIFYLCVFLSGDMLGSIGLGQHYVREMWSGVGVVFVVLSLFIFLSV